MSRGTWMLPARLLTSGKIQRRSGLRFVLVLMWESTWSLRASLL